MIPETKSRSRGGLGSQRSFTLVELLLVIAIISLMATVILVAAWAAQEDARAARTKAQILKLNELIMTRYESYRTRPVAIRIPANAAQGEAARVRLWALRELMRRELPERLTDIDPATGPAATYTVNTASGPRDITLSPPTLWRSYQRRARAHLGANWATTWAQGVEHQGAECLYMIVASMRDGDTNALDFFHAREIGDVNDNNMPEILDAWGNPISFLRWAPGFPSEIQRRDGSRPDPFDPLKADGRWRDNDSTTDPFALFPLIFSAGPDGLKGIVEDWNPALSYSGTSPANDPYHVPNSGDPIGTRDTSGGDRYFEDNIHNHLLINP